MSVVGRRSALGAAGVDGADRGRAAPHERLPPAVVSQVGARPPPRPLPGSCLRHRPARAPPAPEGDVPGRCAGRRSGPARSGPGRAARSEHRPPRTCGEAGASNPGRGSPDTRRVGRAAGRGAATSREVSSVGRRSEAGERGRDLRRARCPPLSPLDLLGGQGAAEADRVLAFDAVARMQDALGPATVVGQDEEALGVLVEPADRVEPGALGNERGRQQLEDGPRCVAVARRWTSRRPAC